MTASLLAMAIVGHLFGDWVLQTDWEAANKTTSWRAMGSHMLSYHWCLFVLLFVGWPRVNDLLAPGFVWRVAIVIGVSLATHAFIDRRWPVIRLMRLTGSSPFSETAWGPMVVDQVLHVSILLVTIEVVLG